MFVCMLICLMTCYSCTLYAAEGISLLAALEQSLNTIAAKKAATPNSKPAEPITPTPTSPTSATTPKLTQNDIDKYGDFFKAMNNKKINDFSKAQNTSEYKRLNVVTTNEVKHIQAIYSQGITWAQQEQKKLVAEKTANPPTSTGPAAQATKIVSDAMQNKAASWLQSWFQ